MLNVTITPEVKRLIDAYAARANSPIWAVVEAAVLAGVPDETGIPTGWNLRGPAGDQLPLEVDQEAPLARPA